MAAYGSLQGNYLLGALHLKSLVSTGLFVDSVVAGEIQTGVATSLRRSQVMDFFRKLDLCLVGLEACGSAHYWAQAIRSLGHTVRMMPPAYVKAYVKRNKTDAADAEAICEAVTRPTMRFVPIKSSDEQAAAMVLKTRDLFVRQRTQTANALRSHMAEMKIVAATGMTSMAKLIAIVREDDARLPNAARFALLEMAAKIEGLTPRIEKLDKEFLATVKNDEVAQRLMSIPGVGPLIAATVRATVQDPTSFPTGRDLAAWIGLTPRSSSSGGKERLGKISKQGNKQLRTLLIVGATSILKLERSDAIKSPGDYLRGLTDKLAVGQFSVGPMLMALLRGRSAARLRA